MLRKNRWIVLAAVLSIFILGACDGKSQPAKAENGDEKIENHDNTLDNNTGDVAIAPGGSDDAGTTLDNGNPSNVGVPADVGGTAPADGGGIAPVNPGSNPVNVSNNLAPKISIDYDGQTLDDKSLFVPNVVVGQTDLKFYMSAEDPDGDSLKQEVKIASVVPIFANNDLDGAFAPPQAGCNPASKCIFLFTPSDVMPMGLHKITVSVCDDPSAERRAAGAVLACGQASFSMNFVAAGAGGGAAVTNQAPVLQVSYNNGAIANNSELTIRKGTTARILIKARDPDGDPIDPQAYWEVRQGCRASQVGGLSCTLGDNPDCTFTFNISCQESGGYPITFSIYDQPTRLVGYKEAKFTIVARVP